MMCSDNRCDHEHWSRRFGNDVGPHVHGGVRIGDGTAFCAPLDINGKDSAIVIGDGCDVAAFVTITTADSHLRCIGVAERIARRTISIGNRVFIGQGAIILGGTTIGDGTVVGAGAVLVGVEVPPNSRVRSPVAVIDAGWYALTNEQRQQRKWAEEFGQLMRGMGL